MTDIIPNKVTLPPFMRTLLLKEVCRRIDIIDYCKYCFNLTFEKTMNNSFTGDCPFCSGKKSFVINRATGKSYCMACRKKEDFLTLVSTLAHIDFNYALHRLSGYLEGSEKHKKAAYAGGKI